MTRPEKIEWVNEFENDLELMSDIAVKWILWNMEWRDTKKIDLIVEFVDSFSYLFSQGSELDSNKWLIFT